MARESHLGWEVKGGFSREVMLSWDGKEERGE